MPDRAHFTVVPSMPVRIRAVEVDIRDSRHVFVPGSPGFLVRRYEDARKRLCSWRSIVRCSRSELSKIRGADYRSLRVKVNV